MRPAVVTAALLLVCILDTVTAKLETGSAQSTCSRYPDIPCGDGWSRIDENHCAKFIGSPETFHEAQEHCSTLNGDLVSVHSRDEMINLLCLTWRADSDQPNIWIGATRSEGEFRYIDGSEFKYARWFPGEAKNSDGQEECFKLNFSGRAHVDAARCSEKNYFVCAMKM